MGLMITPKSLNGPNNPNSPLSSDQAELFEDIFYFKHLTPQFASTRFNTFLGLLLIIQNTLFNNNNEARLDSVPLTRTL